MFFWMFICYVSTVFVSLRIGAAVTFCWIHFEGHFDLILWNHATPESIDDDTIWFIVYSRQILLFLFEILASFFVIKIKTLPLFWWIVQSIDDIHIHFEWFNLFLSMFSLQFILWMFKIKPMPLPHRWIPLYWPPSLIRPKRDPSYLMIMICKWQRLRQYSGISRIDFWCSCGTVFILDGMTDNSNRTLRIACDPLDTPFARILNCFSLWSSWLSKTYNFTLETESTYCLLVQLHKMLVDLTMTIWNLFSQSKVRYTCYSTQDI